MLTNVHLAKLDLCVSKLLHKSTLFAQVPETDNSARLLTEDLKVVTNAPPVIIAPEELETLHHAQQVDTDLQLEVKASMIARLAKMEVQRLTKEARSVFCADVVPRITKIELFVSVEEPSVPGSLH
jgi:hypothetical protein